ncbi:MAG TPA: alpha/beta fold hydrolase, partial [Isosphaeraceae bacterium]|nr:alpha/beta fold hydrolase [Isosphaeraceae bacterium]
WQLPGTLTEPNGAGPFPAVVLVQGSGPHDEDETIGPNKPFKDLAWGLASRGIAVLRYEKRTHKYAEQYVKDLGNLTVKEEVTDDARAAAALLAQQPEVNRKRIYVLGHSLGGMLAPRIAEGDDQIAGIIIMAGSTRPLGQIVVDQIKYLSTLKGPVGDGAKGQIEAAEKFARDYDSPTLKPRETVSMLGIPLPASYVLDLRSYDPGATVARLKIPILVIQGESDYQVTKKDFEGWEKALAGHNHVTMKTYPGLCHLFTPAGNPPSPADYDKPGHVAKATLDDIASWVDAQHGEL